MNSLSCDVEDWYHPLDPEPSRWDRYEDRIIGSTQRILEILDAAKTRATFFVLGYVAMRHPKLVVEIDAAGHEVASHGMFHRFVYQQTPDEFESDVAQSLDLLQSITGKSVVGYRAPYFSITKESLWALPILKKLGIRYDSSVFPVFNHRYGIPGACRTTHTTEAGLIEVPLATYPIGRLNIPCGGGVYFRVIPYRLIRRWFRRLGERGEQVVFYLHPWECDPGHPVLPVTWSLRVRHYWALDKTATKLARLVREFEFAPIRETLGL